MTRVLIGIDFIGANFPAALYSLQQWWNYVSQSPSHVCVVGVSNSCDRSAPLRGAKLLTPTDALKTLAAFIPTGQLAQWTTDIDAGLLDELGRNGCRSQPFYAEFNYGSVDNRLLLLAVAHGCDYLVRIDPGTLPPKPKSFAELMKDHETMIGGNRGAVVSRRYTDRLALRHMYVKGDQVEEHVKQAKCYTDVNVEKQVTGGAMLTFRTPGVPAICLPPPDPAKDGLTLVWASDDGWYQMLTDRDVEGHLLSGPTDAGKTAPSPAGRIEGHRLDDPPDRDGAVPNRVGRADPEGKPKRPDEYYRGILGAACLKRIREGAGVDAARSWAEEFRKKLLESLLDDKECRRADPEWRKWFTLEKMVPEGFVQAIMAGYGNYGRLLPEWEKACEVLRPLLARQTSADSLLASR